VNPVPHWNTDVDRRSGRALDVVRQDKSKSSLSIKLKRAGWDDAFLHSILSNIAEA